MRVISVLDARMKEIYHAAYEKTTEGWQEVSTPFLCLPHDAPPVPGDGWTGCGSGFDIYCEALRARYDGCISRIIGGLRPNALAIARLAVPRFAEGRGIDPADAAPLYIRNRVALKEKER
jgi:tRNA threonylcarbamoyladenosine biosynthesis protein TsaB